MPTILRDGPYRFFFYSGDSVEPSHVHVRRDKLTAKFWLSPVRLSRSGGFSRQEINQIQRLVETNQESFWENGMNTLAAKIQTVKGINVFTSEDTLTVELADGRSLSVPIAWYPRLLHGSQQERENWELIGDGEGIHWPDLDEDISVEGLILGRPSGESQRSLQRWLDARKG